MSATDQNITNGDDFRGFAFKQLAKEQMLIDLELLLQAYNNRDIGLRLISKRMEVSERTLRRLITNDSYPQENTITRFYHYYFSIYPPSTEKHEIIKSMLVSIMAVDNSKVDNELEELLQKNKVFRDIFFHSRTGNISKHWVVTKYGQYGMQIVDMMLSRNVLMEIDKQTYTAGTFSITKGPKTLKAILLDLTANYLDCEKLALVYKNMAFYNMEGLNEEGRKKVMDLMAVFRKELIKILDNKEYHGSEKVFILGIMDTLDELTNSTLIQ